jgi:tetratricopeptide (TPR) repeat protein
MSSILNPYIAGSPVVEPSMFFGRDDVFHWIEDNLAGKFVDHMLVIHGQRRIGKTSILKQLPNYLPSRYVPVLFDLQGRTNTSLDRFFWWLAREMSRALRQERGIVAPVPDREAFAKDNDYLYTHFIPEIQTLLGETILLMTFDEFDTLEQPEVQKTIAQPLIDTLLRMFDMDGFNFIFSIGSSGQKLENMQASYNVFFKTSLYKKISFLSREDSYRLITKPVSGLIEYEDPAVEHIFDITSGHPYFTQLVCHELFSLSQKTGQRTITDADVNALLEDVVERGTVNLKFVWDEASDMEKWLLACLARIDEQNCRDKLPEMLQEQRVRFSESDLNSALLHLREKDVIAEDNRFILYLMKIWLQKNRSLERVREELIEVNPIALRYIDIGEEYRDRGDSQKAIESYQQALATDPGNLRAQVYLATAYQQNKNYLQAAESYEKALQIDKEDVAARAGLCATYLTLGEQAYAANDVDQAIQYYQNLLSIDTDHSEGVKRLTEIHVKQAEEQIASGREEEAIQSFRHALKYTPEDEHTKARYQEVIAKHQATLVAGHISRAQAEQIQENWDEAIAAAESALELSPDDLSLQAYLQSLRQQQYVSQLASQKARAEKMAKSERWEESVQAWEAYFALEPDDRQAAEPLYKETLRHRQLAADYALARKALNQKDYSQAIQLFQAIIIQNPVYKDTARLMADAVQAERKSSPRRLWLIGGGIAILITIIALLVGGWGLLNLNRGGSRESPVPSLPVILVETTSAAGVLPFTPSPTWTPVDTSTLTVTPSLTSTITPRPTSTRTSSPTPTATNTYRPIPTPTNTDKPKSKPKPPTPAPP